MSTSFNNRGPLLKGIEEHVADKCRVEEEDDGDDAYDVTQKISQISKCDRQKDDDKVPIISSHNASPQATPSSLATSALISAVIDGGNVEEAFQQFITLQDDARQRQTLRMPLPSASSSSCSISAGKKTNNSKNKKMNEDARKSSTSTPFSKLSRKLKSLRHSGCQ